MSFPIKIYHPYSPEKIFVHRERLESLKRGEFTPPITVDIDLTDACDHKCPWCEYAKHRIHRPSFLPKEIVFRLLDDLTGSPVRGLIFSGGGEPTTYPSFQEVAQKVAMNNLRAALFTHGGHIHRFVDCIAKAFIHVRVSLDAGTGDTHAQFHTAGKKGSFDRALTGLRMLRAANPHTHLEISCIVTEKSFTEIIQLAEIAKDIGINFLLLKFSRFAVDNQWITADKLAAIQEQVVRAQQILPTYYREPILSDPKEFPVKVCRTTALKTLVAPDGNIYVCNQRRGETKMALGSLHENSFWDIWASEKHKAIYHSINTAECIPCRHICYNQLFDELNDSEIPAVEVSEGLGELVSFL